MSKTNKNQEKELHLIDEYLRRVKPHLNKAPWLLRITVHKGKPLPVLVVKERLSSNGERKSGNWKPGQALLKERGLIYGQPLRRCLPIIRDIVSRVCDPAGIPLELQRFFPTGRISFRGNLPLDEEAGVKLALIFKLQERVLDMNRVELIAWRVERFSREEAVYWLTRATQYGSAASRWAQAGMRIMLGGQPGDRDVIRTLEQLRR